jgi:hypothetical protein
MSLGAALTASLLVTLARPSTWPLALAAFLLRGGILVVAAPILVLPSAVGLANVLAPSIILLGFGAVTMAVEIMVGLGILAVLAWLLVSGLVASAAETETIRIVASDDEVVPASLPAPTGAGTRGRAWRIVAVRWIAMLPWLVACALGAVRIVQVAYRELTVPSQVTVPIAVRIASAAPEALLAIGITWVLGAIVAALAARHLVLAGSGVPAALGFALHHLIRHPLRSALLFFGPLATLVIALATSALAASLAAGVVREGLAQGAGALAAIVGTLLFVALWTAGLALGAVASAWRGAAWTVEVAGTFGGATPGRPGD